MSNLLFIFTTFIGFIYATSSFQNTPLLSCSALLTGRTDEPRLSRAAISTMKLIPLSRHGKNKGKYFAQVDDEDFEKLNTVLWNICKGYNGTIYAYRKTLMMHRVILNLTDDNKRMFMVKHLDGNGLNNQKSNLHIPNIKPVTNIKGEIWRNFENTNYQVSNCGHVRNRLTNFILKPQGKPYHRVEIALNGVVMGLQIHRLVAMAFIPNPENKPQVNHKDFNKLNNHVSNLEWATSAENFKHARTAGVIPINKGETLNKSSLKEADIIEIRRLYDKKILSRRQLSKKYGVSYTAISDIVRRIFWKHIK